MYNFRREIKTKDKLFGIFVFLLLLSILILSACGIKDDETELQNSSMEESEAKTQEQLLQEEKTKEIANEILLVLQTRFKEMKEEKLRKELMASKANIFYCAMDALLYSDSNFTEEGAEEAPHKAEVVVSVQFTLPATEESEEISGYKLTSLDGKPCDKYMLASDLYPERYDFIYYPEENVSYEPFEKNEYKNNPPIKMRGVYVSRSSAANGAGNLDYLIDLAKTTDINAFIIDVKDDSGFLLFKSEAAKKYVPEMNETAIIDDMKSLVEKLKKENIYLVARIVSFKSPEYAKKHPEKSITYKSSGALYTSGDGLIWSSPYNRELWDYNISVAEEAADMGFNEIQFDYVRFPATSQNEDKDLDFNNDLGETKSEAIHKFLVEAHERLSKKEVYITADFFGYVATASDDQNIGQHWESVVNVVDYSAPMVYPSHYGEYNFGIPVPDAQPYDCIDGAMKDCISRNKNIYTPAKLRPWLQDFTAPWVSGYINYDVAEVKAQIKALKDNGIDEYMIWNAANRYTNDAFHND